jgi:hypothetical protein
MDGCAIGAFLEGFGVSNVVGGGPFDGAFIQGPSAENPTDPCGWKIVYNGTQYVFDYASENWVFEGVARRESGFRTIHLRLPFE